MRIINKKVFFRNTISIIILIFLIVFISSNITLSHSELQYKERFVEVGETLWSIATDEQKNNPYFFNKDVREIIAYIKNINNMNTSNIQIGQRLEIPTI